jgi:hypothetical protein
MRTYSDVENMTKGDVFVKACAVAQPAATAATERRIVANGNEGKQAVLLRLCRGQTKLRDVG